MLDTSFGREGRVTTDFFGARDEANAVVVQEDGKAILVGWAYNTLTGNVDFALARYDLDGSLDASYGVGGRVLTDFRGGQDLAFAAVLQRDGKLVVAGIAYNPVTNDDDFGLARYNADGSLDTSFGTDGKVLTDFFDNSDAAEGVAIQPNGRIVVVGRAFGSGTSFDFAMARYHRDGRLDTSFGGGGRVTRDFFGGFDNASAVVVLPGCKLLVGGSAFNEATGGDYALARFEPDGSPDMSFGTGGAVTVDFDGLQDEAFDVAVQPGQRYVLVGRAFIRGSFWNFGVVRFNRRGELDDSFGEGGKVAVDFTGNTDQAFAVTVQKGGKLVVAGSTHNSLTRNDDFALIRLERNGRLDESFGTGGRVTTDFDGRFDEASAVALMKDGRIVVGGTSGLTARSRDFALARYLGTGHVKQVNLLRNCNFEKGHGLPRDWSRDAFIYREEEFAWDTTEAYRGDRSVMISVPPGMPNDARWVQTVPVEPYTRYRLKGWIKTEDVALSGELVQAGANLSILDTDLNGGFTFTRPLLGDNDWTQVELEFDSGPKTQVTVAARLGMYAGTTTGTAWFDHLRLVKVGPAR